MAAGGRQGQWPPPTALRTRAGSGSWRGVVLALILAVVYVLRMMAVVLLAAVTPLALALYALPQTDGRPAGSLIRVSAAIV